MPVLSTWDNRSSFEFTGSVRYGTKITYGETGEVRVSAQDYQRLRAHFQGQTVDIGTSRTKPPAGSLGEWLKNNVSASAIASYVGPILIYHGHAQKIGKSQIEIF
jgi:hypothetical protein